MVTQNYNLNLVPGEPLKVVDVSQYDAESRNIVFSLFSGREKFTIPVSAKVTCDGTKRDGKGFSHDCTFSDNKVTVVPTEDMTAVGGDVTCQLTIEDGGKILGTANFILRVEKAALGDGTDMSPSDIAEAYDIFKKAKEAVENANDATEKTDKATEAANKAAGAAKDAAGNANAAAEAANDEATHPARIINGTWHYWDREKGEYVDSGIDGTVSLSIAEVITGEPGTKAKVENIGTDTDIQLKITIPRGEAGGVTGIKGNAETSYRNGEVNLTPADIGLGNVPNVSTNDQTPTFTQAGSRSNIASGDKLSTLFGKIAKWFADLKAVAFSGKYSDLIEKPTIPAAATDAPKGPGTASAGKGNTWARADHVHPVQTSVTGSSGSCNGNSASATKVGHNLKFTGLTSGTFNGSTDLTVDIPDVVSDLNDGVWKAGQTLSLDVTASGYITSGTSQLSFAFYAGRPITAAGVKVTALNGGLRGPDGYIDDSSSGLDLLKSPYTTSVVNINKTIGYMRIIVDKSSAFTNISNNRPICFKGTLGLSFTGTADQPGPGPEIFDDPTEIQIDSLKSKLAATDYVVIKIAEGAATEEEYADIIAQRQAWRAEINELEAAV